MTVLRRERPEIAVGATVLAALCVLLYASLRVGACALPGDGGRLFLAHFDDVGGVAPRTPIEVAGVPVGRVEQVDLDHGRARMTLRVEDDALAVPIDSTVAIQTRGLLGEKVVVLELGESSRRAKSGDVLVRTRPAPDLDAMLSTLATVSTDVQEVTRSLRVVLGGVEGEENVAAIVSDIRSAANGMARFVDENEEGLTRVVTNLDAVAVNLETFSQALAALSDQDQTVEDLLENFRTASAGMEVAVDRLAQLSTRLESGEGTLGRLLKDDELYSKVDTSVTELQRTLTEVRRAAEEAQEQLPVTVLGSVVGSLF